MSRTFRSNCGGVAAKADEFRPIPPAHTPTTRAIGRNRATNGRNQRFIAPNIAFLLLASRKVWQVALGFASMFLFEVRCQTRSKFSWSGAAFCCHVRRIRRSAEFRHNTQSADVYTNSERTGRSAATLVRLTHPERPELIHRVATSSELDDVYAPIRVNRALMWLKS